MVLEAEVQRINDEVSEIIQRQLGRHFVGLIVQGSAVKGGVIAGSSDIDYVLYVEDEALREGGRLPLPVCLAIHGELSRIEPAPFRYIQFSVASKATYAYLPPIPCRTSAASGGDERANSRGANDDGAKLVTRGSLARGGRQ
ncbi:hypothetical protein [Paenibacillus methanolicus]|uniref:Nucleotidyltransferase-like protein n=1 Tax=Paenibacillus methanolicus TaxID=582686 RepID=A0A5S5BTB9_9BACL|nr:hypothetical protein [Paenibacillus methanolicus]TYP70194.1 hypothetical protein BCM02_112174 [Paenibacillus methanolicus]